MITVTITIRITHTANISIAKTAKAACPPVKHSTVPSTNHLYKYRADVLYIYSNHNYNHVGTYIRIYNNIIIFIPLMAFKPHV